MLQWDGLRKGVNPLRGWSLPWTLSAALEEGGSWAIALKTLRT